MPRPSDTPASTQASKAGKDRAIAQQLERRSQVRGLLLLALAAILFAILRTGVHRVFTVGWWRLW